MTERNDKSVAEIFDEDKNDDKDSTKNKKKKGSD